MLKEIILLGLGARFPGLMARSHCDIPCGIYDPHYAQVAAHTVVRMNMLIQELGNPDVNTTPEQQREYAHKLERYTLVKEEHAELAKHEVRILWGDYFKPDHVKDHPEVHDLVWKVMQLGSKARQTTDMKVADELLGSVNQIATIFWKTKGKDTLSVKAAYPTEREIVVPKLG